MVVSTPSSVHVLDVPVPIVVAGPDLQGVPERVNLANGSSSRTSRARSSITPVVDFRLNVVPGVRLMKLTLLDATSCLP